MQSLIPPNHSAMRLRVAQRRIGSPLAGPSSTPARNTVCLRERMPRSRKVHAWQVPAIVLGQTRLQRLRVVQTGRPAQRRAEQVRLSKQTPRASRGRVRVGQPAMILEYREQRPEAGGLESRRPSRPHLTANNVGARADPALPVQIEFPIIWTGFMVHFFVRVRQQEHSINYTAPQPSPPSRPPSHPPVLRRGPRDTHPPHPHVSVTASGAGWAAPT